VSTITGKVDRPGLRTYEIVGGPQIPPLQVRYVRQTRRVNFELFEGYRLTHQFTKSCKYQDIRAVKVRFESITRNGIKNFLPGVFEVHHWRRLTQIDCAVIVDLLMQVVEQVYGSEKATGL